MACREVRRGPRCALWTSGSASPGMKAARKAECQVPPGRSTQRPASVELGTGQQSERRRSIGERPASHTIRSRADVGDPRERDDDAEGPWFGGPTRGRQGFPGQALPPSLASVSTLLPPPHQLDGYLCVARSWQLHLAAHQEEDSQTREAVPRCGVQGSGSSPAFPVIVMHSDV